MANLTFGYCYQEPVGIERFYVLQDPSQITKENVFCKAQSRSMPHSIEFSKWSSLAFIVCSIFI